MLKRIGAALLVVGLCLPYSCNSRPITSAWSDLETILMMGIPVVVTLAYALHVFLLPIARFHERNGAALHGAFRAVYFVLAGMYLYAYLESETDKWYQIVAALGATGAVLYWSQGRGTKAQRLPLLLLMIVGLPAVYMGLALGWQIGAWVFTAGFLASVAAEIWSLRGATTIAHGG